MSRSPHQTESQFRHAVIQFARLNGWRVRVNPDSPQCNGSSDPGFPDLALWRRETGEFILAELKAEKGKVTDAQRVCLSAARRSDIFAYVWRPSNWPSIEERLKRC